MLPLKRAVYSGLKAIVPGLTMPRIDQLNEAVNFEKRAIFIAVPKTGSTSVRVQFAQPGHYLISNPHLNIMQVRDSLYVYYLRQSLGQNQRFPNPSVPRDSDVRATAGQAFQTFFKFSFVRNPWARTVSLYYRTEGIQVSDVAAFGQFCERIRHASDTCRHPTLHDDQTAWLVDENGQIIMDHVARLEDLSHEIPHIDAASNGRVKLTNLRHNVNAGSRSEQYRELYNARTRLLIGKLFERDIDTFKYVF